mmetsp:Transcript_27628/g.40791  ORF Transcript_27628/g.40791 Transcript_27628/m.40791 type:complete len:200 (-) Transcript_27628:25-624(-)
MTAKRKNCVHFSERTQVHTVERLNPKDTWETCEEASASKRSMVSSVMEIRREQGSSYSHDLLAVYSECAFASDTTPYEERIARLSRWSDRRGLEFHTIQQIKQKRMQQRCRLRSSVIEFQRRLRQEGIKLEDDSNGILAKVAKRLAAPSEAFARTMGEADAIIAKQSYFTTQNSVNWENQATINRQLSMRPTKRQRIAV